ncbi:MAG: hypothetical protein AAAC47_05250, partial [Pararhizobium sp.]
MTQPAGIGNVTPNAALVEMAMSYARSRMLCAAVRLGVADALGDEVRSVDLLAETCQADADALYRPKGKPASQVRDPNVPLAGRRILKPTRSFVPVMGTAPAEDYAPIARAWDFSHANVVADLGGGGGRADSCRARTPSSPSRHAR